ncbi:ferredoxin [Kitasatospora sp. NPDC094028]
MTAVPRRAGARAEERTATDPGTDPGEAVVVRVDRDRCIGSGMCAIGAPAALALGPDGLARPLAGYAAGGGELTAELAEAVEFCPVEALVLHSARGGHRIAPAE